MADDELRSDQPDSDNADRREFLKSVSSVAMGAGLIGGYGAFGLIAGRYLYPATVGEVMWQFVTEVAGIKVGEAIRYRGAGRGDDQHHPPEPNRRCGRLHRPLEHLPAPRLPGALGSAEQPLLLPLPQRGLRPERQGHRRAAGRGRPVAAALRR